MAPSTQTNPTTLQIIRTFKASRENVFKAWTTSETLKQWFGPTDDFSVPWQKSICELGEPIVSR